jgi:hypothetical protein
LPLGPSGPVSPSVPASLLLSAPPASSPCGDGKAPPALLLAPGLPGLPAELELPELLEELLEELLDELLDWLEALLLGLDAGLLAPLLLGELALGEEGGIGGAGVAGGRVGVLAEGQPVRHTAAVKAKLANASEGRSVRGLKTGLCLLAVLIPVSASPRRQKTTPYPQSPRLHHRRSGDGNGCLLPGALVYRWGLNLRHQARASVPDR